MLEAELDSHDIEHSAHSLSDELRIEARRRGLPVDRDVLRDLGHELRLAHGSDVLSQRVLARIEQARVEHARDEPAEGALAREVLHPLPRTGEGRVRAPSASNIVMLIDAIRNPAEATRLRQGLGSQFTLVAVEANTEAIVARIRARARDGDVVHTDELAHKLLQAEMGLNEPEYGHNIAECIAMADVRIDNSGPIGALEKAVHDFACTYLGLPA